jgi:hypothetical protein
MTPDSVAVRVAVLAERRRGVTQWAEHVWRASAVLEDAPEVPPWTLLRTEHDAPDAAEALVAALRASPTAVRILRLEEAAQPAAEPHHRALAEVTGRGVPARRAPTGREAAPAGSFKPPRPARLR